MPTYACGQVRVCVRVRARVCGVRACACACACPRGTSPATPAHGLHLSLLLPNTPDAGPALPCSAGRPPPSHTHARTPLTAPHQPPSPSTPCPLRPAVLVVEVVLVVVLVVGEVDV